MIKKVIVSVVRDVSERKRIDKELADKARMNQILLDTFPCVALLLKPSTREIVASNKLAVDVGAVPGKLCYRTWGKRDSPCPRCLAPKLWKTGETQHCVIEGLGVVWDAYWVAVSNDRYMHYTFDITDRKKV